MRKTIGLLGLLIVAAFWAPASMSQEQNEVLTNIGNTFSDTLESGGFGPEMVVVAAGRFRMGCVRRRDCFPDERALPACSHGWFALA